MIISLKFTCRDFNTILKQDDVIRATLKLPAGKNSKFVVTSNLLSRHSQPLLGQAIPWLCKQNFPLCVKMSRQLPLGESSLVATSALKLNAHRSSHSLATLNFSASHKSISNSNSYMYSIHFS